MYEPPAVRRITTNEQLQQELERYLKLSDGASRILSMAQNPRHRLDAAKTLFVSNTQLMACLRQVQREKVDAAYRASSLSDWSPPMDVDKPKPIPAGTAQPGLARLLISDIRIPLLWRDAPLGSNMTFLMNRLFPPTSILPGGLLTGAGDIADKADSNDPCDGYSVFCLVQIGNSIKDTRLVFDITPGVTDVEFEDKLMFENVSPDFRCTIDVYACPRFAFKGSMVQSRRRAQIMDSLRRTLDQPEQNLLRGPTFQTVPSYFDLVARCTATLADVGSSIRAHTLERGSQLTTAVLENNCSDTPPDIPVGVDLNGGAKGVTLPHTTDPTSVAVQNLNDLPLFGNICYRLTAQPNSVHSALHSGYMWIRKLTASPVQLPAKLYSCELKDRYIWAYPVEAVIDQEGDISNGPAKINGERAPGIPPKLCLDMLTEDHPDGDMPTDVSGQPDVFDNDVFVDPGESNHPLAEDLRSRIVASSQCRLKLAITPKTLFLDAKPVSRLIRVVLPQDRKRSRSTMVNIESVSTSRPMDNRLVVSKRLSVSSQYLMGNTSPVRDSPAELPPSLNNFSPSDDVYPVCSRSLTNLRTPGEPPYRPPRWKSMECVTFVRVPSSNSICAPKPSISTRPTVLTPTEPAPVCVSLSSKTVASSVPPAETIIKRPSIFTADSRVNHRYPRHSRVDAPRPRLTHQQLLSRKSRSLDFPRLAGHASRVYSVIRLSQEALSEPVPPETDKVGRSTTPEKATCMGTEATSCTSLSRESPDDIRFSTFRIATNDLSSHDFHANHQRTSWHDSHDDRNGGKIGRVSMATTAELYELAVCTSQSIIRLMRDECKSCHGLEDENEALIWLDLLHKHVEEQKTWGWTGSSHDPVFP
ncbi:Rhotekin [Clonorchis sinensis]|uniref:Rhotekin n=2 Tax=Clonorchis sinensis TaxID=79923 RepID=A0A8T1MCN9_CLOSI|nr:Rhotekin [Clonorchis sinensis]